MPGSSVDSAATSPGAAIANAEVCREHGADQPAGRRQRRHQREQRDDRDGSQHGERVRSRTAADQAGQDQPPGDGQRPACPRRVRGPQKMSVGGAGESRASASCTGEWPERNRSRSSPSTSRAISGSR
ncbi:hypothetical protein BDW27_108245 [Nocardiopsis sp. L17-MgMaSL7]|nr:hypothetical protein BDW27_108245 [Nocardiopsis sp. L17-MgMaSL7]